MDVWVQWHMDSSLLQLLSQAIKIILEIYAMNYHQDVHNNIFPLVCLICFGFFYCKANCKVTQWKHIYCWTPIGFKHCNFLSVLGYNLQRSSARMLSDISDKNKETTCGPSDNKSFMKFLCLFLWHQTPLWWERSSVWAVITLQGPTHSFH